MTRRGVFLGSKQFGFNIFKALHSSADMHWTVYHPDDAEDGRSVAKAFEEYCVAQEVEFFRVADRAEADRVIPAREFEIGFVCGWYWLLGDTYFANADRKYLGIHNSLLPKYRGGAPLVWSMIEGEDEIGSTLFELGPGMDDGPIVHQIVMRNRNDLNIGDALDHIEAEYVDVVRQHWADWIKSGWPSREQDNSLATFVPQRTPKDGEINWSWPAERVLNFIRAQSHPYPGAFCRFGDTLKTIWRAELLEEPREFDDIKTAPDTVCKSDLIFECGDGALVRLLKYEVRTSA